MYDVKTYSTVRVLFSDDMVRQKRPTGPMWPVDEAWKRDVEARMLEKGISRADLARQIDVDPSAVTVLFKPATKQSRLVPRIHKVLEMADTTAPAMAISKDDAFRRLQQVWRKLSKEEREHLITTGELLASKR